MERTSITLLEALQKRTDSNDWSRFVRIYTPIIFKWTQKLNVPTDQAEDLVQEVFLLVHRKIPMFRYDPNKSFRAWLKRLLRNIYIDFFRRKKIRTSNNYKMDSFPEKLNDDYWAESFQIDLLRQGLKGIRGDFSAPVLKAFELTVFQRLGMEETASQLGVTISMVYRSRSRVLKRLREFMGEMWE